eukprot:1989765-Rhodomonas_salina.1
MSALSLTRALAPSLPCSLLRVRSPLLLSLRPSDVGSRSGRVRLAAIDVLSRAPVGSVEAASPLIKCFEDNEQEVCSKNRRRTRSVHSPQHRGKAG